MRLPPSLITRRDALVRVLVAFGITQPLTVVQRALADSPYYSVVPTGTVAEKQARMVEVEKLVQAKPDDPYAFGEKAQLDFEIKALAENRAYASGMQRDLADGKAVFPQSLTVGVPNMKEAVSFWVGGVGCQVLSKGKTAQGMSTTRIGFGPESFKPEDGAKFALELVEAPGIDVKAQFAEETSVVQYVQLAIPIFRISQVMQWGGEIVSAYGWTEAIAPGGLPLRVSIDGNRRDPFEFVALRTSDISKTTKFYESLGMAKLGEKDARRKVKLGVGAYGIGFENSDAIEVDREPGTIQLNYGDARLSTGLLLLPPKKKKAALSLGTPAAELGFIGKAPATAEATGFATSPEGLRSKYVAVDAFESALKPVAASKPVATYE